MRDDDGYYDNQDDSNTLICLADNVRQSWANVVKAARVAIRGKRKDSGYTGVDNRYAEEFFKQSASGAKTIAKGHGFIGLTKEEGLAIGREMARCIAMVRKADQISSISHIGHGIMTETVHADDDYNGDWIDS